MTIKYLFLSLLLICFVSACTKIAETDIGAGLLPSVDGVITKDTNISIDVKNIGSTDTISPSLYDDHALGYINDPAFGITQAIVNVQMQPTSFPFTFGGVTSLILDSVVLSLDVRGVWGDTLQNLNLHVKEIDNDQPFINDSSLIIYNNVSSFEAFNDITYGGGVSVNPTLLNDSFNFHRYQDSGINALRIRLSDEFGNRLLHTYDSANQYNTDSTFRAAFKGFQISADAGASLLKIGLANLTAATAEPNTKLAIYYRYRVNDTAAAIDTAVKYFTINTSTSAHSNNIKRDITQGEIRNYYNPPTSTKNDDFIYIASAPGTYATVTIDSAALSKLPNYIIHRAEIVMEQAPDPATQVLDNYTAPYLFLLVKPANNGISFQHDTTKFLIPGFDSLNLSTYDASFLSGTFENYSEFGGIPFRKRNTEGDSINYYNFNISRYIQGIVTKKNPQYSFTLYTPYKEAFRYIKGIASYGHLYSTTAINSAAIGRVKLYGGGDYTINPHRMKLHIVYSIPH